MASTLRTLVRAFNNVASSMGGLQSGPHIPRLVMACVAPELLSLLIAERLALERLKRLRGYPDKSVIDAAEKLWREAAEAVRDYRADNP
jgi:S-methylmethionine-dependent homocysteine/selenocysteine methylase